MNSNNFSLDLNKKSCRICLQSSENMYSLNDYDITVNRTLFEILVFVRKTECNLKEAINYICSICKQELSNAYRFIKLTGNSKNILEDVAPGENCTSVDDDNYIIEESIIPHFDETEKLGNDHSNNDNNEKSLNEIDKDSKFYKYIRNHLNKKDDHSLVRHSTPLHILDTDSDCHEDTVCDPLSLSSAPKIFNFTTSSEMMDTINNLETDFAETDLLSSQIGLSTPSNEDLDSVNPEATDCYFMPLKKATTSSPSSQQTLLSTPLCEKTNAIIVDSGSDNLELTNGFQVPFKPPRITQTSQQTTRNPSNTNELLICKYCSRIFTRNSSLNRHITSIHYDISHVDNVNTKTDFDIPCKYCPRKFKREFTLRRHYKAFHLDEATILELEGDNIIGMKKKVQRQGLCPYCGKRFGITSLTAHIRRHTGENPYKCDICEKAYPRRHDLNAHSRIHTVEKPFTCVVCKKTFSLERNLSRHMYVHSNRDRVTCHMCGKGFTSSGDLKIHLRRHTGDLPYICKVCQRRFICISSLNRHHCPGDTTQTKENEEPTNINN